MTTSHLPTKKVSKGTRLAWEESIVQAEGL